MDHDDDRLDFKFDGGHSGQSASGPPSRTRIRLLLAGELEIQVGCFLDGMMTPNGPQTLSGAAQADG